MLESVNLSNKDMIEIGMDLVVQIIKFEVDDKLEDTFITLKLKVLDIVYSVCVPKHEATDPKNIRDGWSQLIEMFVIRHGMGNKQVYQEGSRKLTDQELELLDKK